MKIHHERNKSYPWVIGSQESDCSHGAACLGCRGDLAQPLSPGPGWTHLTVKCREPQGLLLPSRLATTVFPTSIPVSSQPLSTCHPHTSWAWVTAEGMWVHGLRQLAVEGVCGPFTQINFSSIFWKPWSVLLDISAQAPSLGDQRGSLVRAGKQHWLAV